jgi:hypothetical protein
MDCPEKKDLQRECTTAWVAYVAGLRESGLPIDPRGAALMAPSISQLLAWKISPAAGTMPESYLSALHLRGEHLKASVALSKHLSRHRC